VFEPHDNRIATHHTALRAGKNYSPALWHRVRNHGDSGPHESHIAFYGGGPLFCGDTLLPSDGGALPRALRSRCTILSIGLRRYSITRASIADTSTRSNIRFARAAEPGNGALVSLKDVITSCSKAAYVPTDIGQEHASTPFCG
jgi:hypothetical protein